MSIVYIILPVALMIAAAAVVAFVWAVRGGQFDDLDTPPLRILHDDESDLAQLDERNETRRKT